MVWVSSWCTLGVYMSVVVDHNPKTDQCMRLKYVFPVMSHLDCLTRFKILIIKMKDADSCACLW